MTEDLKVQVTVDGEPELTSTVSTFTRAYKVVASDGKVYYATVSYEEASAKLLGEDESYERTCTEINTEELPEDDFDLQNEVEEQVSALLVAEGINIEDALTY